MPIFPASFTNDSLPPVPTTTERQSPLSLSRRTSEESIRTDLCEGPVQDEPLKARTPRPELDLITSTSDRAELIERLKRGESPTWIPNRRLDTFYPRNGSCDRPRAASPRPKSPSPTSVTTITAAANTDNETTTQEVDNERLQEGLNIERPRSALHSGDFTQHLLSSRHAGANDRARQEEDLVFSQPQHAWFATSPPRDFTGYNHRSSPSSLSSSLSSSFVYKHPTSPLVQSESNDDSSINSMDLDPSTPTRITPRRQTPHSYSSTPVTAQRIPTSMRREGTFPYQAHQPRKSLTPVPGLITGTSPRRTSVGLELSSSPLQQTSMVGSYEESILRGRMSTTPSKPLDFLAQIGVLGLGTNCKSSLRCPAHVTLPFPAVFYSYASTPHGRSNNNDDGPSPYVGQVDLENGLPNPEETARARRRSHQRRKASDVEMTGVEGTSPMPDARDVAKQRRRTTGSGPKAPPGGSYRIPEKGQIQIIIKNQNKTAVKLFLVPYDLAGMEPGTKTFIRQRSYSGGPIVDGEEESAANNRPVLRYLVHLHICCPARGRFYLYKSIRVVFANRVPDGKEKLRNEVTLPEPKFTQYKPIRVMHPPTQQAGVSLAAEKAFRRRSSGFSFGGAMGQHQTPDFSGFSLRARASSVQSSNDRGTILGRPYMPFTTVVESPTSVPTTPFVPLNFAKGGYGHNNAIGNGSSMVVDGEGLLSQRLRSLGMGIGRQQQILDHEKKEDDDVEEGA